MRLTKTTIVCAALWLLATIAALAGLVPAAEFVQTHDTMSMTWLIRIYGILVTGSLFMVFGLAFFAWQSVVKDRLVHDLRFFVGQTVLEEQARQAYARFGLEEGSKRKQLAELALEAETMSRVAAMTVEVQDAILRRERYARIAEHLGLKLASN